MTVSAPRAGSVVTPARREQIEAVAQPPAGGEWSGELWQCYKDPETCGQVAIAGAYTTLPQLSEQLQQFGGCRPVLLIMLTLAALSTIFGSLRHDVVVDCAEKLSHSETNDNTVTITYGATWERDPKKKRGDVFEHCVVGGPREYKAESRLTGLLFDVVVCTVVYQLRMVARAQYGISGNFCEDAVCSIFCWCLVSCQLARTLKSKNCGFAGTPPVLDPSGEGIPVTVTPSRSRTYRT